MKDLNKKESNELDSLLWQINVLTMVNYDEPSMDTALALSKLKEKLKKLLAKIDKRVGDAKSN